MVALTSYSIANTNMVSGTLAADALNWITCPKDASGNSPKAVLIQCTDWLKIKIYTPEVDWADTHDMLASIVQVKGMAAIMCPVNTSALWVQNIYSGVTVNYYITPLDDF